MDKTKTRRLVEVVKAIDKQFGKGTLVQVGGKGDAVPVIPTGSLALDLALGVGGWPRGRVCEAFGNESGGKTTLALHAIAEAQRLGDACAFIDAEHALDIGYAQRLGVNVDELLVCQPDCGEQALEVVDSLVRTGEVELIVIDSVAALTPRAEIEGEMGDAHMGLHARLMSQALRKLTATIAHRCVCVIFINQIRHKIGVFMGNPETTTGGNALKFYASVRLDVRRIGTVKQGETAVANRTRVKVVKNKVAPPFRQAEFEIRYGTGIDAVGEVLDLGAGYGLVEKSGAWFSWKGERIGQGREKALAFLREHPVEAAELREAVTSAMKERGLPAPAEGVGK